MTSLNADARSVEMSASIFTKMCCHRNIKADRVIQRIKLSLIDEFSKIEKLRYDSLTNGDST